MHVHINIGQIGFRPGYSTRVSAADQLVQAIVQRADAGNRQHIVEALRDTVADEIERLAVENGAESLLSECLQVGEILDI